MPRALISAAGTSFYLDNTGCLNQYDFEKTKQSREMGLRLIPPLEIRHILKLVRELCRENVAVQIFNSTQQFFQVRGDEQVAEFVKACKKLSTEDKSLVASALSLGQIDSKNWLVEKLTERIDLEGKSIVVVGGWVGLLPLVLFWSTCARVRHISSIDFDSHATEVAEKLNMHFLFQREKFSALTKDMREIHYLQSMARASAQPIDGDTVVADIVVNTSCEHVPNLSAWFERIPDGTVVVLQSNDFFACESHVNCVHSVEELEGQAPMKAVLYRGDLPLPEYNRFMLIGRK